MNNYRQFRDVILSVVLLAIPFFVLQSNLRSPENPGAIDRAILSVSAPFQSLGSAAASSLSGILERYVYLVETAQENDRLERRLSQLQEDFRRLEGESLENDRLRALLQMRETRSPTALVAEVISKETSPHFRVIRIELDRGERDRISPGQPIVVPEGLVGQVRRVWGRYCDVSLVADRSSAVDVVVARTGARGLLRGTGEEQRYAMRLEFLSEADRAEPGDIVETSGLGHRFPAGLRVGRIVRTMSSRTGVAQEFEVEPSVEVGRLREVLILPESGAPTTGSNSAPRGGR